MFLYQIHTITLKKKRLIIDCTSFEQTVLIETLRDICWSYKAEGFDTAKAELSH